MDIIQVITRELNVEKWQVEAAVRLIDEGCTIPFISRYRKEATGTLNDEQLRNLNERLTYLRNLEDKKAQVLGSIEEQGKLTPELKKQIEAAQTLVVVEDLYRPYRPKRRTRAIIAREKGLGSLADIILLQMTKKPLEEEAKAFIKKEERKVMLVTTTFKIEKKNVNFSRILFIKTYDVFCYFLLFQEKMIDKIWKKSYSIKKGNIVEILYMSGSSKTHI